MLPDSEPFKGANSPFKKMLSGPTPLSPSAANIKASMVQTVKSEWESKSLEAGGLKSANKTRKLFTASVVLLPSMHRPCHAHSARTT